jgi:paraquat-inducible protein B
MADDLDSNPAAAAPVAKVEHKRRFSLIWLIPIVAAIAGAFLVYRTFAERGPDITIVLETASGIEPGKTQIRYRDVQVGLVENVALSPDTTRVIVTARMEPGIADKLREGTQFWVESARITAGGVSGLGTLFSGAYIGMRPGPGQLTHKFTALETPPVYQVDHPGRRFTLRASRLGSVSAGAPIFFRGIQVGGVLGYQLDEKGDQVSIFAFVREPYDAFVRNQTRFWNASGIDVSLTAGGLAVHTESLQSILIGGIAFDTPVEETGTPVAAEGAEFPLFASYEATQQAEFTWRVPFRLYFEGSVAGLEPGAPVTFSGMKLGEVTGLHLEVNPENQRARIPVTIALEPQRWRVKGDRTLTAEEVNERVGRWVERGLRAQLQSGNLLTGQQVVALVLTPDAPKATLTIEDNVPVIPTVPSKVEALTEKVTAFLDKLDKAPIAELVSDARAAVRQADQLLASPSLQKGMAGVAPLVESLRHTADAARATLASAELTLGTADQVIGRDSALRYDLARMLRELTSTARSLRTLADFLERNPNALLLGKPVPGEP